MSSSGDFHKNQYEQGRVGEEEKAKEKVTTGMRAVLQNYISREEADTGRGMGKFDALIHDRISLWRTYERTKKVRKFTLYFIASFFIVPMLLLVGSLNSWGGAILLTASVGAVSWGMQFVKTITIRAYAPTDSRASREGVRKAISDIWFETLLSVRLAYLWGLLLLFTWGIMGYFFGNELQQYIVWWVNLIIGFFGKQIVEVEPYYFVGLIFSLNFASLMGDYLFWRIFYARDKRSEES